MFIFLSILIGVILCIVAAAATNGYAKYRWPSTITEYGETDDNDRRLLATTLWPFYWLFVWPFTKVNELTFSHIEKTAALHIAKNKARIDDLNATREQVEASNVELERAEVELEREMGKL